MKNLQLPRLDRNSVGFVTLVFVLLSLPFLGKPVHIDDSLFLWAARNIQLHPTNFYGFDVNWYGFRQPMWEVTKNPPLACYYAAGIAAVLGTREWVLHLAFLLPAVGTLLGAFVLARELCARPAEAVLVGVLTPAFFVSSTTLMCDMLMLCAWVWAIVLWRRGERLGRPIDFAAAALLMGVAALTKYFGIALVPLLLVDALVRRKHALRGAVWLALPVGMMALYELLTRRLYGRGLFFDAMFYARAQRGSHGTFFSHAVVGLIFLGGCCLPVLFYALRLWKPRQLLVGLGLTAASALWMAQRGTLKAFSPVPDQMGAGVAAQGAVLLTLGVGLGWLVLRDLREKRDADSLFLCLWLGGTFIFATFFNWSANARSLLPLAPAFGILIVRALPAELPGRFAAPLWLSGLSALLLAHADLRLAESAQSAATALAAATEQMPSPTYFEGHWGFQYYAQLLGLKPLDLRRTELHPGDHVLIAVNNTGGYTLPHQATRILGSPTWDVLPGLTTMDANLGAGFYSAAWGPLPFAVGRVTPEQYHVVLVTSPLGPTKPPQP